MPLPEASFALLLNVESSCSPARSFLAAFFWSLFVGQEWAYRNLSIPGLLRKGKFILGKQIHFPYLAFLFPLFLFPYLFATSIQLECKETCLFFWTLPFLQPFLLLSFYSTFLCSCNFYSYWCLCSLLIFWILVFQNALVSPKRTFSSKNISNAFSVLLSLIPLYMWTSLNVSLRCL